MTHFAYVVFVLIDCTGPILELEAFSQLIWKLVRNSYWSLLSILPNSTE